MNMNKICFWPQSIINLVIRSQEEVFISPHNAARSISCDQPRGLLFFVDKPRFDIMYSNTITIFLLYTKVCLNCVEFQDAICLRIT